MARLHPVGTIGFAPGTWGSLASLPLAWAMSRLWTWNPWLGGICFVALSIFALFCIQACETELHSHDDKSIVIDETIGMCLTFLFVPFSGWSCVVGFILFRLFDIWKPSLIGKADKSISGAFGTLLDDVLAGFAAACCLWVFARFLV